MVLLGEVGRGDAIVVLRAGLSTGGEEHARQIRQPFRRDFMKRGEPALLTRGRVGAAIDEQPGDLGIGTCDRGMQRGDMLPVPCRGVDVGALREQDADRVAPAEERGEA